MRNSPPSPPSPPSTVPPGLWSSISMVVRSASVAGFRRRGVNGPFLPDMIIRLKSIPRASTAESTARRRLADQAAAARAMTPEATSQGGSDAGHDDDGDGDGDGDGDDVCRGLRRSSLLLLRGIVRPRMWCVALGLVLSKRPSLVTSSRSSISLFPSLLLKPRGSPSEGARTSVSMFRGHRQSCGGPSSGSREKAGAVRILLVTCGTSGRPQVEQRVGMFGARMDIVTL